VLSLFVLPRQIAMFLFTWTDSLFLYQNGAEFGGKDHTTVIHAYEKINQAIKKEHQLKQDIRKRDKKKLN